MFKIVQAPTEVLYQKAKSVAKIDKAILSLLKEMEVTLENASDPEGVGLAAPQVGKSLQIFIVRQTPKSPLLTFINPIIESYFDAPPEIEKDVRQNDNAVKAKEKAKIDRGVQLEGCLSLKDIWGVVTRKHGLVLSYQDENGVQHKKKFEGFLATIIQHEFDHLNGILFPKRVIEQDNKLYKSIKNKDGETEFEEIEV
jgi:peptide deformylase